MKIVMFITLFAFCVSDAYSTDSLFIYDQGVPVYSPVDTTRILIDWSGGDDSDLPGFLDNHPHLDTWGETITVATSPQTRRFNLH